MRRLLRVVLVVVVVGFINYYLGSPVSSRGPDLTPGQIKIAYAICAQENDLPLKGSGYPPNEPVPIEELSTKNRNVLLGCALESGSYNFVRWALQKPKEMLSIESKFNGHWPVASVARWANGRAAADTLKLILEPNDALWKVNSSASLMVALYEVSTVDAAEYLAERYNYLLTEDNRALFAHEDYPKYFGLTLAQYHAFSGRIEVAEYFAGKGSRVAIPGMNFRQWILAHDQTKLGDDKLDAFLAKHGVSRDNREEIAATPAQPVLVSSASALKFPSANGYPLMLGDSSHALWMEGNSGQRWDPITNELKDKFELPFPPEAAVETAQGIVFVAGGRVAGVTRSGKIYSAGLTLTRSKQRVVLLADQSVLVLDGVVKVEQNGNKTRSNVVDRIVFQPDAVFGDALSVERMPDLPGAVRTAFSTVALADGRAMVLGGTEPPYVGCWPCTAETWFLDPKGKTWSAGPKMNEARSDMSATALLDGGVLVAGGWTPEHGWGGAGSRTVERWDPQKNTFVPLAARMTSYVSMHRALWLPGLEGKQLLLAGGNSAAIQVYDVEHDIWRVAGENCQGTENDRLRTVIPLLKDNRYSVIVQNANWCPGQDEPWGLVSLRLPLDASEIKNTARSFSGDSGVTIYRGSMAFLPGQNDGPSLALGGTIHAGMNSYVITSAADAFWPDGHIQSLPGFVHARSGARLFRLADGALLLTGGQTDVGGYDHAHEKAPSAEWLPGNSALEQGRWQPFELGWSHDVLGQMANGSLVALSENGEVSSIKISADALGKPHAEASELPPLPRPRLNPQEIVMRGLRDGRIIVAGGTMQNKRLAIMSEHSMEPNATDEYLRIGEAEPTNDYDIYEPAANQWRQSATSPAYGGVNAIYDDGRVVHLYAKAKREGESAPPLEAGMAMSSADGRLWNEMKSEEQPDVVVKYNTRLFVLQDELFVAGEQWHMNIQTLQWFNSATRRWETLWQSTPQQNWRDNVGRIIIRQLANGKCVMLPVAGM